MISRDSSDILLAAADEEEVLPEAAILQGKYNTMQAERAASAEAQAGLQVQWEAAGRRKCVVVHPTVVRAGFGARSPPAVAIRLLLKRALTASERASHQGSPNGVQSGS